MRDRARILHLCIAAIVAVCACSSEERVLGERCRNPYTQDDDVTLSDGGGSDFFGTSCAPCDADDIRLDDEGCPIYVTFASCGGDICLGDVPVTMTPEVDAGVDDDAGADEDGGPSEEDSGAD